MSLPKRLSAWDLGLADQVVIGLELGPGLDVRLGAYELFQPGFVLDQQRRTTQLRELFLAELPQQPGDSLPRCADQLSYFLVGKRDLDADPILGNLAIRRPLQEQAGQLF